MQTYRPLSLNSQGQDVAELQKLLSAKGYPCASDGVFGAATRAQVMAYQQDNGLSVDGVVGANTWAKLHGSARMELAQPQVLMLHTSATPENDPRFNAEWLRNLHVNVNKWGRPGYSKVIEYDGAVKELWRVDLTDGFQPHEITYGAAEYNPISVHFCYVGGTDKQGNAKDTRTPQQKAAMEVLVREMLELVPNVKIGGHNQFHNKACPCFSVPKWLKSLDLDWRNVYSADPFGHAARMQG